MRSTGALLSIILIVLLAANSSAQNFIINPEKPQPGEKVTVKFNPSGTPLDKAEKVELYAYLYTKDLRDTRSSEMVKEGMYWTGTFSSDENDLGAVLIFKNEDLTANNNKEGYIVHMYNDKGEMLPGSIAGLGYAYFTWTSYYLDFDRNAPLAYELMNRDFEQNPSLKIEYVKYFIPVYSTVNKENSQNIIKEGASLLETKKQMEEDDYITLIEFYRRLKDTVNTAKYEQIAIEKYPEGTAAQVIKYNELISLKNPDDKTAAVKEFRSNYPESRFLPGLYNSIIKQYLETKEYNKLKNFFSENIEFIDPFFMQSTARKIADAGGNLNAALDIASMAVTAAEDNKEEKKPEYLTDRQWEESRNEYTGQGLFAKGKILYMLNRKQEALTLLTEAVEKTAYKDAQMNYYYSRALLDEKEYDKAFEEVSKFVKEGNATGEMGKVLEESFAKVKGTTEGFTEYYAGLQKEANKKIAAKLEHEMINEPAPNFKLVDLKGTEVSLDQYKGKVVILDFWATWCGPCISSFPAMKNSVEKYSKGSEVEFLFINSWERVDNKKQNAEDFMTKNGYPFHVLLDLDNKVIESYKVSGIPTKFIIDKKGNIRFKSVGYSGNNDQMTAEIDAMISMIN